MTEIQKNLETNLFPGKSKIRFLYDEFKSNEVIRGYGEFFPVTRFFYASVTT